MTIVASSTRVPVVPVVGAAVAAQFADDLLFLIPGLGVLGPLAGIIAIGLTFVGARVVTARMAGPAVPRTGLAIGAVSAGVGLLVGGLGLVTILLAGITVLAGVAGAMALRRP